MLSTIGHWLVTIPLENPWRAIILVLVVLGFALVLHMLWELGFTVTGELNRLTAKLKASRSISVAGPSVVMSIKSDKAD